jgi:hypothetical protein
MRLSSMTTGSPNHEVEDSDEETNYSETVQYYDEEATAKRWYSPMAAGIKWALWAGHNESSTAERGGRPAYSKLETRRSDELDWRDLDVPIVSSYSVRGTYTMSSAPLHLFTQAHCQLAALCCFILYCSSSLFY